MLNHKNIIITGAGRGIGREIAKKLSAEGATLALIARTGSELKETLEIIRPRNTNTFYLIADISDEKEVINSFNYIIGRMGKIDCLINNAGIQPPIGVFYDIKLEDWKKNLNVNLFGTVNYTYAVINKMIEQRKGKIVNLSGGGSTSPRPNFSAYGVSKTAIVRFTETLAEEVKQYNVDVNAIAPGAINTKMLEEVLDANKSAGREFDDAIKRKKEGGTDPNIAADLICFLCSDMSDGITGKLISAPWDDWKNKDFQEMLKTNKDFGTLRRIDNKTFFKK